MGREGECIERTGGGAEMPLGQMQIDGSDFEVAVAKQYLDGAQVSAGFEKVCGEAMPQGVRMDVPMLKAGALGSHLTGSPKDLGGDGITCGVPTLPGKSHSFGLCRSPRQ